MLAGTVMPTTAVSLAVTDASSVLHPAKTAKVIKRYIFRIYLFLWLIYKCGSRDRDLVFLYTDVLKLVIIEYNISLWDFISIRNNKKKGSDRWPFKNY